MLHQLQEDPQECGRACQGELHLPTVVWIPGLFEVFQQLFLFETFQQLFGFLKLSMLQEWVDRKSCEAVCDGAFMLESSEEEYPFALSFIFSKSNFFCAEGRWRSMTSAQVSILCAIVMMHSW